MNNVTKCSTAALLLSSIAVINTFAAPPPVTISQPVQISGVVEDLSDVLHQPYNKSVGTPISADDSSGTANFDVPTGKRLIIETITFHGFSNGAAYQRFDVHLIQPDGLIYTAHLAIQERQPTPSSGTLIVRGTHPVKLRVDAKANSQREVAIEMVKGTEYSAGFTVSVHGYLVDIP